VGETAKGSDGVRLVEQSSLFKLALIQSEAKNKAIHAHALPSPASQCPVLLDESSPRLRLRARLNSASATLPSSKRSSSSHESCSEL
jgi:hypothetical protein